MWRRPTRPAMRKADVVLIVLGVLAVWATLAGALAGDRWTDERTVRFATMEVPLGSMGPEPADGAGARLDWTVPPNATAANFVVLLTFQGQAIQGGTAVVSLRVTTPDGHAQPPVVHTWTIPQGATGASLELNATAQWFDVPGTLRDTTSSSHGVAWNRPLEILVVVEAPGDLPVATYSFEAGASAAVTTYAAL